ncbi:hypothetical protein BDW68DRAFT_63773 [Aspergillus falconensis]
MHWPQRRINRPHPMNTRLSRRRYYYLCHLLPFLKREHDSLRVSSFFLTPSAPPSTHPSLCLFWFQNLVCARWRVYQLPGRAKYSHLIILTACLYFTNDSRA